jgi:hypothetical protein
MLKLRFIMGFAALSVSVAALTLIMPGRGEAQIGSTPVRVVNIPLPVSGSVNAAVTGQVTVGNQADSPVLIRNVDGQGATELWQTHKNGIIPEGTSFFSLTFDAVPAGKVLVVEHVNTLFQNLADFSIAPYYIAMNNLTQFTGLGSSDGQYFVPQRLGLGYVGNSSGKFYVKAGASLSVATLRQSAVGQGSLAVTATGYFVPAQ